MTFKREDKMSKNQGWDIQGFDHRQTRQANGHGMENMSNIKEMARKKGWFCHEIEGGIKKKTLCSKGGHLQYSCISCKGGAKSFTAQIFSSPLCNFWTVPFSLKYDDVNQSNLCMHYNNETIWRSSTIQRVRCHINYMLTNVKLKQFPATLI